MHSAAGPIEWTVKELYCLAPLYGGEQRALFMPLANTSAPHTLELNTTLALVRDNNKKLRGLNLGNQS